MEILKILNILAASKEDQISYLTNLGTYPCLDELALEFGDEYKIAVGILNGKRDFVVKHHFNVLSKLNQMDSIFEQMSNMNRIELWDADALGMNPWNKIRELANEILCDNTIADLENNLFN